MIRRQVIERRLRKLDDYLNILHELQKHDFQTFVNTPQIYGSTERFLHLAIEAIIDMGNHVVAGRQLGEVSWYSDIPQLLFEAGYITESLKETWLQMIGFRNILVHDYLDIEHKTVYDVLQNYITDLEKFKSVFGQFL